MGKSYAIVAFIGIILVSSTFTIPPYYQIENQAFAQQQTETITLSASKDSFLTQGSAKDNEGANPLLRIISSDKNRPVIAFDQTEIEQATTNRDLVSATLRLYAVDNGNNWGPDGRLIGTHQILQDWTEGNGWNVGNNISGTGDGTTWNCPIDTDISNNLDDCAVEWDGGSFVVTPGSTNLVTNDVLNQFVEFDVTTDVQSFLDGTEGNFGWIVKKDDEAKNGTIEFASKESSSNTPQLVVVVNLSLFNQYEDLLSELGIISQISDEAIVADYLVDSITKLKTDTQNLVTDVDLRNTLVSILDSALQSASDAGTNALALDESGANLKIAEAKSFVDSYANQVAIFSETITPPIDPDWQLREQAAFFNSCVSPTPVWSIVPPLRLITANSGLCHAYTFKTFDKVDIIGKDLLIDWEASTLTCASQKRQNNLIILDGAYDRNNAADIPFVTPSTVIIGLGANGGVNLKGGGILHAINHCTDYARQTESINMTLTGSVLPQVTVMVYTRDGLAGASTTALFHEIEIPNFGKWEWDSSANVTMSVTGTNNDIGITTASTSGAADILIAQANQISIDSLKREIDASNLILDISIPVTEGVIDLAKSKVEEARNLVVAIEAEGFNVEISSFRASPTQGQITFSNPTTSQVIEIFPSIGVIAVFATIGLSEDLEDAGTILSSKKFGLLLNSMLPITLEIATVFEGPSSFSYFDASLCHGSTLRQTLGNCLLGAGVSSLLELLDVDQVIQDEFKEGFATDPIELILDLLNDLIPAKLTVIKNIVNDDGGSLTLADVTLRINGTVATSGNENILDDGTYQVSEDPIADYDATITGDCDANGFITLDNGDEKICTITNNDVLTTAELTVIKRITNDNGGSLTLAAVTLRVNGTAVTNGTVNILERGTYQVSEDPTADYFVTITGDCDANGFVTLGGGDEKTCTITNNDTGPLPVFLSTANSQIISAGNLGAAIDGNLATCTGGVGYRSTGLPFAFFIYNYDELIGGDVSFRYRGTTGTSVATSFGVIFDSSIDGINWIRQNSTSYFLSPTIEDIDTGVDDFFQFLRVGFARAGGQLTLGAFQICEISVVPKNVVPLAFPQSLSVTSEVPLQITLQGLDEDEGNTLTFSIVDPPQGQLSAIQQVSETSATVTYTSNVGFVALDSFTFKVNDGEFDSQTVTVDINVTAP